MRRDRKSPTSTGPPKSTPQPLLDIMEEVSPRATWSNLILLIGSPSRLRPTGKETVGANSRTRTIPPCCVSAPESSTEGVRPVLLVETTSGPLIVPATTTLPIYAPSGAGLWLGQTVTDEGYPSTTTHSWALLNSKGSVIFSSPNSSSTSVTFSAPGRYILRYVADDGAQPTSRDYVVHVAASIQI